jgi:hypothetical protein
VPDQRRRIDGDWDAANIVGDARQEVIRIYAQIGVTVLNESRKP